MKKIKYKVWLWFHEIDCLIWNWRLPKDLNDMESQWRNIDRRRDKSLSSKDFRFWLYIRKVNK
jgi:hypothetical protein